MLNFIYLGTVQEQWPLWNHMEFVRTSAGGDGPKQLVKCDLCPYVASMNKPLRIRKDRLRLHIRDTHGPKRFVCQYCARDYSQSHMLKDHVNVIHLNIKAYKCKEEGCGYETGYSSRYEEFHVQRICSCSLLQSMGNIKIMLKKF